MMHDDYCRVVGLSVADQSRSSNFKILKEIVVISAGCAMKLERIVSKCYKPQHHGFYRAMHFSAKRGIAIACRLSVRPSVCL